MAKIDIHTHILPPEIPDFKKKFGYGGFIKLANCTHCDADMMRDDGTFFRKVQANCWDPKSRIADCDQAQTTIQVLSTVPVMFSYWTKPEHGLEIARYLNDHIAGVVASHPKRFLGLGSLPMQDPKLAIQELERCKQIHLNGIQIATHIQGTNLNDPGIFDIFSACQDLDMAVFIHPWDMMGQDQLPDYWLPWLVSMPAETSRAICHMIFGGVFERLPRLRVAFAHGGGSFPGTIARIQHGFEVRPDLCARHNPHGPRHYLGKFWVDSLVHEAAALQRLGDLVGWDKIALGSDYPFPLGEAQPGSLIESMDLSQDQQDKLLFKNAIDWLGLSNPQLTALGLN